MDNNIPPYNDLSDYEKEWTAKFIAVAGFLHIKWETLWAICKPFYYSYVYMDMMFAIYITREEERTPRSDLILFMTSLSFFSTLAIVAYVVSRTWVS